MNREWQRKEEKKLKLSERVQKAIRYNAENECCSQCEKIYPEIKDNEIDTEWLENNGLAPHVKMMIEATDKKTP